MRRLFATSLVLACLVFLVVACYRQAILAGEQFAFRDASQYYYPLYQRVQTEWKAGRWPLWEPEENSGTPLLGNPTAAVLYPGKIIFALVDYPLAARLYVMGHTVLAFAALLALARHWGVSWAGSTLGALSYAFGGPVLFQYCNIIFLVGAAWLPLGFRAADRWLRLGRRSALAELGAVLALETLGGDPQAAYLTGLCAGGYAAWLARPVIRPLRAAGNSTSDQLVGTVHAAPVLPKAAIALVLWIAAVLAAAYVAPSLWPAADPSQQQRAFAWARWWGPAVSIVWGLAGCWLFASWLRSRTAGQRALAPMLLGLLAAAAVGALAAGAQLLPVLEFIGQSGRASSEAPHEIYPFSLHPIRLVEFIWPNVFGSTFHGNTHWLSAVPIKGTDGDAWVPTLYLGGVSLVLALSAVPLGREGRHAPWRPWMAVVALAGLLGSFGEYGSPLWLARMVPQTESWVGPSPGSDSFLRDCDGGVYWFLATVLPGFGQFRYPSKLLTLVMLGVSVLAAEGYDALAKGDRTARRRALGISASLVALSLVALSLSVALRRPFLDWLEGIGLATVYGPLDAPRALAETQAGLLQASIVFAATLGIALGVVGRRPAAAAILALVVTSVDLAMANARYVLTVPQSVMDSGSEALAKIEQAERDRPGRGPYRIHRVPFWWPRAWDDVASDDRVRDFVAWERRTLAAKQGINLGVDYTVALSVTGLYDYNWFFGSFFFGARERASRALNVEPGTRLNVYSRRAFNLWNTRYFILPYAPLWGDQYRGIASFLVHAERIYPPEDAFRGPGGKAREEVWARQSDYQILRNLDEHPRAWVVHEARTLPAFRALERAGRDQPMEEMLFSNDMSWPDPTRVLYDPMRYAWIEEADRSELSAVLPGGYRSSAESVRIRRAQSDRVELEAVLERPGFVVLADVYYPGWNLTIDGQPARIYRANHMMRGAAVRAGKHALVYSYRPASFRVGLVASCLGIAAICVVAFRPEPRVAANS